jgi:hypothetical protein
MEEPIDVPSTIWFSELPSTPEVKETESEVVFDVVPGRSPAGPTVVLAGRYYVTSPILDEYGGQLPNPIRAVAVDAATGRVYSEELTSEKSPPVAVLVPEDEPPADEGRFQSGAFDVDLPAQLGLPSAAATYQVFLWLDRVLSPVESIAVPESAARTATHVSMRKPESAVRFEPSGLPAPAPESIVLQAAPGAARVEGSWLPEPTRAKSAPYFLTILAFHQRDRTFGWTSIDVNALPDGTYPSRFEVDVNALLGEPSEPQKTFVLALAPAKRGKVLVLPAR